MAAGRPKWPDGITATDDRKPGICKVFLTIPNMKVEKKFMQDAKPTNALVKPEFTPAKISVTVELTEKDGSKTLYQYRKNTPEDIVPEKCKCKYEEKRDHVIVCLAKEEEQSWGMHYNHLTKEEPLQ